MFTIRNVLHNTQIRKYLWRFRLWYLTRQMTNKRSRLFVDSRSTCAHVNVVIIKDKCNRNVLVSKRFWRRMVRTLNGFRTHAFDRGGFRDAPYHRCISISERGRVFDNVYGTQQVEKIYGIANMCSHGSKPLQATDSSFYLKNFISVYQLYNMFYYL